jgi:hypothetical protein
MRGPIAVHSDPGWAELLEPLGALVKTGRAILLMLGGARFPG